VSSIGFSRAGELLVIVGEGGDVRLWNVAANAFAGLIWKGTGAPAGPPRARSSRSRLRLTVEWNRRVTWWCATSHTRKGIGWYRAVGLSNRPVPDPGEAELVTATARILGEVGPTGSPPSSA